MRFKRTTLLVAAIAVSVLAISTGIYFIKTQSRFGPGQANAAQDQHSSFTSSQTPNTVILEEAQLKAIKIEPVGTHLFRDEREAVGSIDFDEDTPVVQAESALIGAAGAFQVTSKELVRAKNLYAANVGVSQKELDQAVSDQQTAESALKAAREVVRDLGKTDVEIDHMIATGRIESETGSRVAVANVAESDTPLLHVEQQATVKVITYPDRVFKGKIYKIYAVVDPNTHRTKIRAKVADPRNELRPGMLASIMIRVREPLEAVAIPATGVVREGDGTMTVWVTTDRHQFLQRTVKLGLQRDRWDQIVEGLKPGELAVIEGGIFLSNMLQAPPSD